MTPERAKELLPIIQAYAEGKYIQARDEATDLWFDVSSEDIYFENDYIEYRIKPEPKVIYVNEYKNHAYGYDTKEQAEEKHCGCIDCEPVRKAVRYIEASD